MREIKFRAWDKSKKCWAKIKEWSESGVNATIYDERPISHLELHNDEFYEWNQFTGLKDKNGKEIYEGDIMKTSDTGNLFEVIFDDKAASFKIIERSNTYAKNRRWMMGWDVKRRAVIGNIYQNPELLNP